MRRLSSGAIVAGLLLAIAGIAARQTSTAAAQGLSAHGLWFGTVFYGDPADPSTPTERFTARVAQDGTYIVDSTAETGSHPLNPGAKTPEHGVWSLHGRYLTHRGIWFDEGGGGAGFSVGISVGQLEFVGSGQLNGLYDVAFLPCPGGPAGCPDPTGLAPLQLGGGLGPFPVILRRVQ
jgi:hypothetical protein